MQKILVLALLFLLQGCGSLDQLGETLKWLGADSYPVKVAGALSADKEGVFLRLSRVPAASPTVDAATQQAARAMLERNGFRFAATEANAKQIADVKMTTVGPEYESKTEYENGKQRCSPDGKNCTYDQVEVTRRYSICTYFLDVTIAKRNKDAATTQADYSLKTFWKSPKNETLPQNGAWGVVAAAMVVQMFSSRNCADEADRFYKQLIAVEQVISRPDVQPGIVNVLERRGQYKIQTD